MQAIVTGSKSSLAAVRSFARSGFFPPRDIVLAFVADGAGSVQMMLRQVLPDVMPLILVSSRLTVASAILSEPALTLPGLADPTNVSWGSMLNSAFAQGAVTTGAWWYRLTPGVAILIVVLGFTSRRARSQPPDGEHVMALAEVRDLTTAYRPPGTEMTGCSFAPRCGAVMPDRLTRDVMLWPAGPGLPLCHTRELPLLSGSGHGESPVACHPATQQTPASVTGA